MLFSTRASWLDSCWSFSSHVLALFKMEALPSCILNVLNMLDLFPEGAIELVSRGINLCFILLATFLTIGFGWRSFGDRLAFPLSASFSLLPSTPRAFPGGVSDCLHSALGSLDASSDQSTNGASEMWPTVILRTSQVWVPSQAMDCCPS